MEVKKYNEFYIAENLDLDKLNAKLTEDYKDLKSDLIDIINDTMEETSDESIKNEDLLSFIDEYISKGKDANLLDGLIEDNDIFNFYLKHQSDIDELLNSSNYMDKTPKENNVFSLYDVIMDGTKESIIEVFKLLKKELQ